MNAIKTVNRLSLAIYFIFFPVFWIAKRICSLVFNTRKAKVIRKAEELKASVPKRVYVVQNGNKFLYGTREQLRRMNCTNKRKVKGTGLTFDYRKAVIYTAK